MHIELIGNPDYGHVRYTLHPGETVYAESGAMLSMDSDLTVDVEMLGGPFPAIMRRLLAGESLLVSTYRANSADQRLSIAPTLPGQVMQTTLGSQPVLLTAGSFLACTDGVSLDTVFGGIKSMFSGEGMFFILADGNGELWFNAYGAIVEKELNGEELIVDTGHVVGWESSLEWTIQGMGNLMATIFSGEGLVIKFSGHGKLWLQTRSVGGLVDWIKGYC